MTLHTQSLQQMITVACVKFYPYRVIVLCILILDLSGQQMHNVAEFITACKKLKVPEQKVLLASTIHNVSIATSNINFRHSHKSCVS